MMLSLLPDLPVFKRSSGAKKRGELGKKGGTSAPKRRDGARAATKGRGGREEGGHRRGGGDEDDMEEEDDEDEAGGFGGGPSTKRSKQRTAPGGTSSKGGTPTRLSASSATKHKGKASSMRGSTPITPEGLTGAYYAGSDAAGSDSDSASEGELEEVEQLAGLMEQIHQVSANKVRKKDLQAKSAKRITTDRRWANEKLTASLNASRDAITAKKEELEALVQDIRRDAAEMETRQEEYEKAAKRNLHTMLQACKALQKLQKEQISKDMSLAMEEQTNTAAAHMYRQVEGMVIEAEEVVEEIENEPMPQPLAQALAMSGGR